MRNGAKFSWVVTACLGLALTAGPASADIVVGEGIAGVSIGMSKSQVVDQMGKPRAVKTGTGEFGKYKVLKYGNKGRKLTVTITFKQVTLVSTAKPGQRTVADVGVNSTKKQVQRGVAGVICGKKSQLPRACHVNSIAPGKVVTVFRLTNKTVQTAEVGLVVD